jgi:hypothetical protein
MESTNASKIMKQSAVEWLANELFKQLTGQPDKISLKEVLDQAKKMEKQQIDDAWDKGYKQGKYDPYFDNEDDDDI